MTAARLLRPARLLGAAAGVLVVGILLATLGPARIAAHLRLVGVGFSWLLAACLLANLIYSMPLGLVLPRGVRPSSSALFKSRLAAVAVNAATPLLGVGGEPVRLLWFAPGARRHGAAGLFVDRGAFLVASAIFLAGGATVAGLSLPLPRALHVALAAAGGLGLALALLLLALQRRGGVASPLARVAGIFSRRHRERLAARAREVDDRVRALHLEQPGRFAAAVCLHALGRCAAGLEVYAGARLLGMPLGPSGALVLAAAPLAVDLAFSMVPSQIGLHEGASAFIAQALGCDPAAGLALAFLQRLRQVVFVGVGFAVLALRRARTEEEAPAPPV